MNMVERLIVSLEDREYDSLALLYAKSISYLSFWLPARVQSINFFRLSSPSI